MLDFVKEDIMLSKVAKIFITPGMVYPECFFNIVDDVDGLITNLMENGYINKTGEVKPIFWGLKDYSKMRLWSRFRDKKRKIYRVIYKSLELDNSRSISKWLHTNVHEIYEIRRKIGRTILKYLRTLGFQKEDLL